MPEQFDLIVIGAGSAGREAARKATLDYGARVALLESTRWGGSCPNVACQPTKAYLVAAELVRDLAEHGAAFGIESTPPELAKIHAWKESIKRTQSAWERYFESAGIDAIKGEASLVDAGTVRVDGRTLGAERVLVATGSRTAILPVAGLDAIPWLDHVTALDLTVTPESLLVVGAGPVGLEFAQIFARFGARVTVVDVLDQVAARSDAEAAAALHGALEAEGIEIVLGAAVERFARDGSEIVADLVDGPQFTPVAGYQSAIAVDDMFGADATAADYSLLPTAIFTDPELAALGLTEADARARGFDVETVVHPVSSVTRAYFTNSLRGLFKIVFDRTTRHVLGVHVVSRNAGDVIGGFALAFRRGLTVDELAAGHYVYPSFSEGLKEAAQLAPAPVSIPA
jgi:mercuric reductase